MEFTNKAKILVLFANAYNIKDESNKVVCGTSVHYLFWGENGEQLLEQSEWDESKPVGVQRAKCSLDFDARKKIPIAPAIYEGTFQMAVGSDGKAVLKLVDVAYFSNFKIEEKHVSGLQVPGMVEPTKKG